MLAKRILKVLFSIAWTIIAAELFLRIFHPVPILPRYVASTDYGVRANMANQSYWHRTPEYVINIRTNNKGLRADEDIPYEKPPGVKRIVVLGDSFGMGYGVDLEDTFLNQMNQRLRNAGYNTQVVNLSVSGYGTAEELLALRHEGIKYDPDLVIVVWHHTDLQNNQTSNLFSLSNGRLARQNDSYQPAARIREILFSYSVYRWIAGNSHLYTFLREKASSLTHKIIRSIQSTDNQSDNSGHLTEPAGVNGTRSQQTLAVALLHAIRKEGEMNEARTIILDIPLRISRTEFVSTFPSGENNETYDLDVVNPIPVFRQHKGEMLYWEKSHGHFTPLGCRLVGQVLARHIVSEGLLDSN